MKITSLELSPEQKRKWIETRSAVLWSCPAFTHILYSMLNPTGGELAALFTEDVPIAATDGSNLILNPKGFFAMDLSERVFVIAHEIMHCILNHCSTLRPYAKSKEVKFADGKKLPYDSGQMNIAMDLIINDILIQSRIGTFPKSGVHDTKIATQADNFLDTYRKIFDPTQQGKGSGGFDVLLPPGAGQGGNSDQASQDRSQAAWDTAVAGAMAAAKSQGKLPAALERALGAVVNPEVPWQDVIRAFFARKVGSGGYDWRKPDRRLIQRDIITPARAGNGCGEIVVAIDTSGSIGQTELDVFFAEMRGILDDVRPTLIHVVWCDAKVHKVDEVEDSQDVSSLKPHGGGGTDFRPVFDWIDAKGMRPEALVYLTDGYGSFPNEAPAYPVVWGCISGAVKYPFGDVVPVPIKHR